MRVCYYCQGQSYNSSLDYIAFLTLLLIHPVRFHQASYQNITLDCAFFLPNHLPGGRPLTALDSKPFTGHSVSQIVWHWSNCVFQNCTRKRFLLQLCIWSVQFSLTHCRFCFYITYDMPLPHFHCLDSFEDLDGHFLHYGFTNYHRQKWPFFLFTLTLLFYNLIYSTISTDCMPTTCVTVF